MSALLLALALNTQSTAPHGLGVEDTYTITSVMEVLPPVDPASMTDEYQDVAVVGHKGGATLLSVTYFPLNDRLRRLRVKRYASQAGNLRRYLDPTVTCNWDAAMQTDVLRELKSAYIQVPNTITLDFVRQVARWALSRSTFDGNSDAMPPDWFVTFRNGRPQVPAELRHAFEASRPVAGLSDEQVFERQLFGRQMFISRRHGQCTSTAIYLATILRSLGVPTRILYFIPPCDGNDASQVRSLAAPSPTTRSAPTSPPESHQPPALPTTCSTRCGLEAVGFALITTSWTKTSWTQTTSDS